VEAFWSQAFVAVFSRNEDPAALNAKIDTFTQTHQNRKPEERSITIDIHLRSQRTGALQQKMTMKNKSRLKVLNSTNVFRFVSICVLKIKLSPTWLWSCFSL
jgi:hypothetical protein